MKHVVNLQKIKKIFSFLVILLSTVFTISAQNFYWENPESITNVDSRFPITLTNNIDNYVFWQEVDVKNKQIYLSCRQYLNLNNYIEHLRFAGPFNYSGDEVPDIFTAAINKEGTVVIALLSNLGTISTFCSNDKCNSFEQVDIPSTSQIMVAPRIFAAGNGQFKLFTSVGKEDTFTIFTSDSNNGKDWSKFSQFQPVQTFRNPFIPYLITAPNGNDIVVFQAQYTSAETNRFSYQLYMTVKNGRDWSSPVLITGRNSFSAKERKQYFEFQNQRPALYNFNNEMYVAWERSDSVNSSIWIAKIDNNGIVPETAEEITNAGNASRPAMFEYDNSLCVTWFDTRRGKESVYFAKKNGSYWTEFSLVEDKNSNQFVNPLVVLDSENSQTLAFIWQQTTENSKNNIAILSADKSVLPPDFKPLSFKKGKRSRNENVQIQILFPKDSSNISGYSYTWGKDNQEVPPKEIQHFVKENKIKEKATEDGIYTLRVRVADYAGNWSEPAEISYHMDLIPPLAPAINFTNIDDYGFIDSNNYNLKWQSSLSEDVAGYSYRIDYLGDIPKNISVSKKHPMRLSEEKVLEIKQSLQNKYQTAAERKRKMSSSIMTTGTATQRYYNKPNGVYVLSVSAIDEVGNVSEPNTKLFILNKFQPSTYITSISQTKSDSGDIILSINGGGFTYDGTISEIYIDADGKAPYDITLKRLDGQYKVQSDTKITNLNLGMNVEKGDYKIGLLHTDRGLYFTKNILKITENGTVKIESEYVPEKRYNENFTQYKYKVLISLVITFVILLLIALIIIFTITTLNQSWYEKTLTQNEAKALITGARMPLSKLKNEFKKLPSLKKKLIRFTFALIVVVVLAVSFENGYKVVRLQEQTMAAGLQNRTDVLLESLHSGVKNFFPANNILELTALPGQKDAMTEVKYVTIIGQKMDSENSDNLNYVWATNDAEIEAKTDSYRLTYGETEIKDDTIINITKDLAALDKEINTSQKDLSDKIDELTKQAEALYNSGLKEDEEEADRISDVVVDLRNKMDSQLAEYSKNAAGSYPYFDTNNLNRKNTDYIFYRPVMYRKGTTGNYIHGVVYLELSTQTLIDSLNKEIRKIVLFSVAIAIIAVITGIIGSYLFASLIVKPIQKLEKHVNVIGQTKNKANLKGKDVEIKTKDEVGRLGDAINNMTHELVANAEEEALAMDGKAVQKAFLPLVDSGANNKMTFAEYKDNELQCYGYYEGESGVSGDYFDYKRLDKNWFCIIKCDASGHGIPAAIIMTVVATIFRRYFENWNYAKNGIHIDKLVEQINDFIEGLGLKGKFATLIICLLNVETGELYMCNAGDNLVHIYDSASRSMKLITLSSAPTAGVFSSDLIAMRGGFKVEKTILNKGDILFLYTDGIEESTRRIREFDYTVRQNEVEVKKMNPKTHEEEIEIKLEDAKEEFGPDRIKEIIESVYNKKKYVLTKLDNPNTTETLEFDFTKCEGTVSEAILALASIEKVYRLYKSPTVQKTDYIKIDKKIDEFLSRYFNMYEYYSANKSEVAEGGNYVDYDQMLEDEQSDDLTMLAIKRM